MDRLEKWARFRIRLVGIGFVVAFLLIGVRAFRLQVLNQEEWQKRAERQHQKVIPLAPQRGTIYDHNGEELAVSVEVDSIYVEPAKVTEPARTVSRDRVSFHSLSVTFTACAEATDDVSASAATRSAVRISSASPPAARSGATMPGVYHSAPSAGGTRLAESLFICSESFDEVEELPNHQGRPRQDCEVVGRCAGGRPATTLGFVGVRSVRGAELQIAATFGIPVDSWGSFLEVGERQARDLSQHASAQVRIGYQRFDAARREPLVPGREHAVHGQPP